MTKAVFYSDKNDVIYGFSIVGHTADIECIEGRLVCAAISSAAYMAVNTITEIIGDRADACECDGKLTVIMSNVSDKSQVVLQGLLLHLQELEKQYKHNIKVILEVQPNA